MKTPQIAYNYTGLDANTLATKGQGIYDKLNNNNNFTTLGAYLPSLQTNTNALTTAITAGGLEPTKAQTEAIHAAEKELRRILKIIGATVNYEANGNATLLLTSGFDLKTYTPPSPKTFNAKLGKLSGEVDLEINSYGNAAYEWYMSPDPIGNWVKVNLTTVSKTTIKGLTPGTKLWFRVSITKGKSVAIVSDPYTIMVV